MSARAKSKDGPNPTSSTSSDDIPPARVYERELLYGEAMETIAAMLQASDIPQRELARRLDVSEARVSRIMSGGENLTLKTIADLGWVLGVRFALAPRPLDDRSQTPAADDPPPPPWLKRLDRISRRPA